MRRLNVVLSSAGRRVALARLFRQSLSRLGVVGDVVACDADPLVPARVVGDRFVVVPRVADPAFAACLFEAGGDDALIVPTIDTELGVLAAYASGRIGARSVIAVSSPETVTIAADKVQTGRWLEAMGFPSPQRFPEAALNGELAYPVFFKPRFGSLSVGATVVHGADDLARCFSAHPDGVVDEYVVGPEYTVDTYVDRTGRCRAAVPRRRIRVRAGEILQGMTEHSAELEALAAQVAEKLPGAWGPLAIQMIVGTEGPRVIEINARFAGGYPLSHHAGARLTEALILEALGERVQDSVFEWRSGVVMMRFDDAFFIDHGGA